MVEVSEIEAKFYTNMLERKRQNRQQRQKQDAANQKKKQEEAEEQAKFDQLFQTAQETKKGFFGKVADFGIDTAKGVAETAVKGVKGGATLISKIPEIPAKMMDTTRAALLGGQIDSSMERSQNIVKDYNKKIDDFVQKTGTDDTTKMLPSQQAEYQKLLDEKAILSRGQQNITDSRVKQREEATERLGEGYQESLDAAADLYAVAQYAPGVSLGAETIGLLTAKAFGGDDGVIMDTMMKITQDIDNFSELDEKQKKSAMTTAYVNAGLGLLDLGFLSKPLKAVRGANKIAETAGLSSEVAKTMAEKAFKDELKKSAATMSFSELAKVPKLTLGKEFIKEGVKGIPKGTGTGIGFGLLFGAMMGEDVDLWSAASRGAQSGFFGRASGAPLNMMEIDTPSKMSNPDADLDGKVKKLAEAGESSKEYQRSAAIDAAKKTSGDNLPYADGQPARDMKTIGAEVEKVEKGVGEYAKMTPEQKAETVDGLINELYRRADYEKANKKNLARQAKNFESEPTETLQNRLSETDIQEEVTTGTLSGDKKKGFNTDNSLYTKQEIPQTAGEVETIKGLPKAVTNTAKRIATLKAQSEQLLSSLMTPERFEKENTKLAKWVERQYKKIEKLPAPIQDVEMEKVNAEYMSKMDSLQEKLTNDQAQVEEQITIQQHLADKESRLLSDVTEAMEAEPDKYTLFDPKKADEKRKAVQHAEEAKQKTSDLPENDSKLAQSVDEGVSPTKSENPDTQNEVKKAVTIGQNFTDTPNDTKVGFLNRFYHSSSETLRKWGVYGNAIADTIEKAVDITSTENHRVAQKVYNWATSVGGKKNLTKVAMALDNKLEISALNDAQQKVYYEAKDLFADYARRLNLPEEAIISNYLPHLMGNRAVSRLDEVLSQLNSGKSLDNKALTVEQMKELNKELDGLDYATLDMIRRHSQYTVKNGFLQKRTGATDYSFDLSEIVLTYASAAHRSEYMKPALETAKKLSVNLTEGQNKFLGELVQNLNGKPSDAIADALDASLNKIFSSHKHIYTKGSAKVRSLIFDATLGLNPGSALRNLGQAMNNVAKLPVKYVASGTIEALNSFRRSGAGYQMMLNAGVLDSTFSDMLRSDGKLALKGAKDKLLWGMFSSVEQFNRGVAFFGKRAQLIDDYVARANAEGKAITIADIENRAIQLADSSRSGKAISPDPIDKLLADVNSQSRKLVKQTQFEYSPLDMPLGWQSPIAKNLLMFKNYDLNQVKFVKNMIVGDTDSMFVKNDKGTWDITAQGSASVAKYIGGNLLFAYTVGQAVGMDWTSMIPFYNDAMEGNISRSPVVQLVFGDGDQGGGITDMGKALKSADPDEIKKQGSMVAENAFTLLAPAGTQMKKTYDAVNTIDSGFSTNKKGQIRFAQDTDDVSKLQSILFGQYNTDAGKDWLNKGMPTLSEKQTLDVYGQKDKESQLKTIDYYQTLKSLPTRDKAMTGIRKAVQDGKRNKALRLQKEYNTQVIKAIQEAGFNTTNLSDEMLGDLNSRLIDDKAIVNDAKKVRLR